MVSLPRLWDFNTKKMFLFSCIIMTKEKRIKLLKGGGEIGKGEKNLTQNIRFQEYVLVTWICIFIYGDVTSIGSAVCHSMAKLCLTLCDLMDCSTTGFSVLHCFTEFAQTCVHWVGDAIQPFHPLSSPSPLALNLSQLHSLFQWVSSSHQVAKISGASASASVLPMNIQCWFPLQLTGLISLQSKGLSRVLSNTTIWRHQFFDLQPSLWSNSHLYVTTEQTVALTRQTFVSKVLSLLFDMLSRFVIAFLPRSKHF